MLDYSYNC